MLADRWSESASRASLLEARTGPVRLERQKVSKTFIVKKRAVTEVRDEKIPSTPGTWKVEQKYSQSFRNLSVTGVKRPNESKSSSRNIAFPGCVQRGKVGPWTVSGSQISVQSVCPSNRNAVGYEKPAAPRPILH